MRKILLALFAFTLFSDWPPVAAQQACSGPLLAVFDQAGQSNAEGKAQNTGTSPAIDPAHMLAWWNNQIVPWNDAQMSNGGSMEPAFERTWYSSTHIAVMVVPTAVGATSQEPQANINNVGYWDTSGTLLQNSINTTNAAITAAKNAGWCVIGNQPIGVQWVQGENDALALDMGVSGVSVSNYKNSWYNTITAFQQAWPGSFFYVWRIGVYAQTPNSSAWAAIRQAQEDMTSFYHDPQPGYSASNMRMVFRGAAYALSNGNNLLVPSDGIHWDQELLNAAGKYGAIAVVHDGITSNQIIIEPPYPNDQARIIITTD